MGVDNGGAAQPVTRIERVRCLGCGVIYAKPTGGGTVSANPGCPECGYVGWVLETLPFLPGMPCSSAPSGIACGAEPADEAHAPK